MLGEIQSGEYAKKWIAENEAGRPWLDAEGKSRRAHLIECVGERLRAMTPFLEAVTMSKDGTVQKARGQGAVGGVR